MSDLHIPEYGHAPQVPTQDAYDAACRALEANKAELGDLRSRALAVADEYDREPRLVASAAVAAMLREWVGDW